MKLTGFRYLKKQRILTLTLILTASSMLFSLTAFSLQGFYRGFTAYLGEGEDIIAIYNPKTRTHFTSLVPAYLAEKISMLKGVLASSPEALIPCTVNGEALFLRGIIPKEFTKLTPLKILEGNMLELADVNSIILGKNAAQKLGLNTNDKVLVLGVLSDRYLELQVKGIFTSNSAMDDEVLAPLYVGQWLRRADYGQVTLIRVKIDRSQISPSDIMEMIAKEASEPTSPTQGEETSPPEETIIPQIIVRFKIEDVGVEEARKFMKNYLDRYGLTREALLVLSAAVFLFSSISIAAAAKTVITQHKGEIAVLRSVGASKKLLKRDILTKLLPWSLIASTIGITLAAVAFKIIQENSYLQVLSHTIPFQLDPLIIALNIILSITLVSISVLRERLE